MELPQKLDNQSEIAVACEQALCLGKKIARKGFSLSLIPRSTKGLFTG